MKRRFTPKATESLDLQFMQQAPHTPAEDGGHKVQTMEHGQDHEMMSHLRERLAPEDRSKDRYFNGDNDAQAMANRQCTGVRSSSRGSHLRHNQLNGQSNRFQSSPSDAGLIAKSYGGMSAGLTGGLHADAMMSSVVASSHQLPSNILDCHNNFELDPDTQQKQYDQLHLNLLETIKIVQGELGLEQGQAFERIFF